MAWSILYKGRIKMHSYTEGPLFTSWWAEIPEKTDIKQITPPKTGIITNYEKC